MNIYNRVWVIDRREMVRTMEPIDWEAMRAVKSLVASRGSVANIEGGGRMAHLLQVASFIPDEIRTPIDRLRFALAVAGRDDIGCVCVSQLPMLRARVPVGDGDMVVMFVRGAPMIQVRFVH